MDCFQHYVLLIPIYHHNSDIPGNAYLKLIDCFRFNKRHVALKICYLGWDYQGLAVQEDTIKTIETEVFNALLKTRLIESRETSNYHRCGRTDKGVSAFGQVYLS